MKAVGLYRNLPIENEQAQQDAEIAKPSIVKQGGGLNELSALVE